jgi:hypothetical protein
MNKHWRMPLPTAPLTASVTVVKISPPMTTVGRGIDPPLFPSPAMTSKDASFCYPSCSGNNESWRHSLHNGSGEGIYPPPSPSPAIVSEDAPLLYPLAAAVMAVVVIPPMMVVGRNRLRQPRLHWRQCPRPRRIGNLPSPPPPLHRQTLSAFVEHTWKLIGGSQGKFVRWWSSGKSDNDRQAWLYLDVHDEEQQGE